MPAGLGAEGLEGGLHGFFRGLLSREAGPIEVTDLERRASMLQVALGLIHPIRAALHAASVTSGRRIECPAMSTTLPDLHKLQADSDTRNTRLVGYHDLNGYGDGMQLVKNGPWLYVAHLGTSPMALSILDASDPTNLKLVRQIEHPPNTHRHKVQVVGNVLIQNSEVPYFGDRSGSGPAPITGLCVFKLDDPSDPQQIGFHAVPGNGVHRIWFSHMPYAHIAAWLPDARRRAYQIVDLSDPTRPTMAGSWWVPGSKDDDVERWEPDISHSEIHGVIPYGNRAYASCIDAGFALLDISDITAPQALGRVNWYPPYGGYLHTSLPLPDRKLVVGVTEAIHPSEEADGDKRIWLIDVRNERQPVTISSFPKPRPPKGSPWGDSFWNRPLRFGPHNVHENRPNSFNSETLIFSTWYNAGLRIHDISDADRPTEVGHYVPPAPEGQKAPQINDVFVDADRLVYITDRISGGVYVVEFTG